jgi:hypothetical protein
MFSGLSHVEVGTIRQYLAMPYTKQTLIPPQCPGPLYSPMPRHPTLMVKVLGVVQPHTMPCYESDRMASDLGLTARDKDAQAGAWARLIVATTSFRHTSSRFDPYKVHAHTHIATYLSTMLFELPTSVFPPDSPLACPRPSL